jgi:putative endonuclease
MYGVRSYYVYMLRCMDGSFYTGMTNNIDHRYWQHESGYNPTCYTYTRRPLRLVYVGEFQTPGEAINFEKQVKRWSHKKKRAFADREWPLLKRLAAGPLTVPAVSEDGGGPSTTLGMTKGEEPSA